MDEVIEDDVGPGFRGGNVVVVVDEEDEGATVVVDVDGVVDVVITNLGTTPTVLLNSTQNDNQKVTFSLTQSGKNKDAIGSRVTLKTDKRRLVQEIQAGASYLSQNDFRLHFGLGQGEKIESVEVRWSDGTAERLTGVEPNRLMTLEAGKGVVNKAIYR